MHFSYDVRLVRDIMEHAIADDDVKLSARLVIIDIRDVNVYSYSGIICKPDDFFGSNATYLNGSNLIPKPREPDGISSFPGTQI